MIARPTYQFLALEDREFITIAVDLTLSAGDPNWHRPEPSPVAPAGEEPPALNAEETLSAGDAAPAVGKPAVSGSAAAGTEPVIPSGDLELSPALSITETDEIGQEIVAHLPLADAVVRLSYRATEGQHRRVDEQALLGFLVDAGAHRVYGGIQWVPVRESRARVVGVDESLSPLFALGVWCGANDVDEQAAGALRDLTAGYLEAAA